MRVQEIKGIADFEDLRPEWNALLERSQANCVFLTWEWLHTWWKHLAERRKLAIVAVRSEGRLVGLAPLTVRPAAFQRFVPFRCTEFLGSGTVGSDYLDLIIERGSEDEVLDALLSHFQRSGRLLELGQLKQGAQAIRLVRGLERSGWRSATTKVGACPWIPLLDERSNPQTWTGYLESLSKDHRYNIRRKTNGLDKHFEATFERVENEEQLAPALQTLIDLHRKRWDEHGDSDAFHTPNHVAFHQEFTRLALARGWLRLFVLRLNGQPASAVYALSYGGSFSFYQSGFDPQFARNSVGLVAMAHSIKSAIEEGAGEYDFLHGTEAYKSHWAHHVRELERIQLYPPGLQGWCQQSVLGGRRRARELLRPAVPEPVGR